MFDLDEYFGRVAAKQMWGNNWPFPYECTHSPEDIWEHLYFMRGLAEQCSHITEFGVRDGYSTLAWLTAKPKVVRCYDVAALEPCIEQVYAEYAQANGVDFQFVQADDLTVEIEITALLFIDTVHKPDHLKKELSQHAQKARKYIVMHDTVSCPSLWNAINPFLAKFSNRWRVEHTLANCNGLTVLKRFE